MKKETQQLERRGLPGGPNEMFTYTTGVFSTEGFRMDSPDVNNYQNIIPTGSISMKERDGSPLRKGPIHGVDNLGNQQVMYPGYNYQFPGTEVTETLMAKMGGALLDKTIKCGNCGWEWKAADGGSDVMDCHKCGGKGLVKAQGGTEVKYGTPEYRKAYNKGEVITDEGVRSPILLDEVVVKGKKRNKGFWEQSRDKYLKDHQDDGLFGAIGSVVTYPLSIPQHALTYATEGKVQDPSEAWGYNTNERWLDSPGAFGRNLADASLNIVADPSNLVGAGVLTKGTKVINALNKGKVLSKGIVSYGDDLIQASKIAGKPKLPTYNNAYRWQADVVPESLINSGKSLTAEQQALTGSWYTHDPNQLPFYMRTRPGSGNVNVSRLSDTKIADLERNMSDAARGMSGRAESVAASNTSLPGELILPKSLKDNVKQFKFDVNPSEYPLPSAQQELLKDPSFIGSPYHRSMLQENTSNIINPILEAQYQPIMGIPRKYFPYAEGGEAPIAQKGTETKPNMEAILAQIRNKFEAERNSYSNNKINIREVPRGVVNDNIPNASQMAIKQDEKFNKDIQYAKNIAIKKAKEQKEAENKFKALPKAEQERILYEQYNQEHGSISEYKPNSTLSKVGQSMVLPFTALKDLYNNGEVRDNLLASVANDPKSANAYDAAYLGALGYAAAPYVASGATAVTSAVAPYTTMIGNSLAANATLPYFGEVAGLNLGNAITSAFATHGAMNITPDATEMYKNPSWGNFGNVAMDTAEMLSIVGPVVKTAGEGLNAAGKAFNTTTKTLIKQTPIATRDFIASQLMNRQIAKGLPEAALPERLGKIDLINKGTVNVKNDYLQNYTQAEYDAFLKTIYERDALAYDNPMVEFKGNAKPASFFEGMGNNNGVSLTDWERQMRNFGFNTKAEKEGLLFKEKFCMPGSECAKSANAITNKTFGDITGNAFNVEENAHNAWHMEDQMIRNGGQEVPNFQLKIGDRVLMGNGVDQSTYVPGYTADPSVRHAGMYAGLHENELGNITPLIFESGKNSAMYLNPVNYNFAGEGSAIKAIRPQQFIGPEFGEALVDKNIRYAFRDKPSVATYSSENKEVQKILNEAEKHRDVIKKSHDITNDEFDELLNNLVGVGVQETKLNGALPGSTLAKAKIELQNILTKAGLTKPIKQILNTVKNVANNAKSVDTTLPKFPGASVVEMEAAKLSNSSGVPFQEALSQIKANYQAPQKFTLSTPTPSKGMFRQKFQTESDKFSGLGTNLQGSNSLENGLGQMAENYNNIKNLYPNATPRELMDLTTLMWNSPGKAKNAELVDFYLFGKNNPDASKFKFDYIKKINNAKDKYINIKPTGEQDPYYEIFRNGNTYPEIQYQKGGESDVDMYGNPIIAKRVDNPNLNRSYYDPRLNTMNIGTDYDIWGWESGEQMTGKDLEKHRGDLLAHENYHAKQHKEGKDNYDIAHHTDQEQWVRMQKKPQMMTTDEVWNNYYNRSSKENDQDYINYINAVPEARILNPNLLFDKMLDGFRYSNPFNQEGEAMYYNQTGKEYKQKGGESKPGSLMQAYNKLPMKKKMGGAIANKKQFGGQLNSSNITMYRDYIKGIIGNETEAVKNYDKLNRIYYNKAKELGMTAANYVMTYVVGNS